MTDKTGFKSLKDQESHPHILQGDPLLKQHIYMRSNFKNNNLMGVNSQSQSDKRNQVPFNLFPTYINKMSG